MLTSNIIETERLKLVTFDPAQHLNDTYVAWLNDPDVVRYSEQRHKSHTLESCAAFTESFNDSPSHLWAIMQKTDNRHIGNIHADIDPHNGIADVAILLGARDTWDQGYGLEAWNGVLGHLKSHEDIRKIIAGCMRSNAAMYSIMTKSGMIDDGQRQKHYFLDGKPEDIVFFALQVPS
jgi:ribosomal-protein-alanine N-acetyltransferase